METSEKNSAESKVDKTHVMKVTVVVGEATERMIESQKRHLIFPKLIKEEHGAYVTLECWDEILRYYEAIHDYSAANPEFYQPSVMVDLEKMFIQLIEPVGYLVRNLDDLEAWKEREISKMENFVSPHLPKNKRIYMTATMNAEMDESTKKCLQKQARKIQRIYKICKEKTGEDGIVPAEKRKSPRRRLRDKATCQPNSSKRRKSPGEKENHKYIPIQYDCESDNSNPPTGIVDLSKYSFR